MPSLRHILLPDRKAQQRRDDGSKLYMFCQGYRRKRAGMMRNMAGKGTIPPVHRFLHRLKGEKNEEFHAETKN
jgi:hypothetical protein